MCTRIAVILFLLVPLSTSLPAQVLVGPIWTIEGNQYIAQLGSPVAGAGDVNGDGFGDVLVGSLHYDAGRGRAFLHLGSASGPSPDPIWTTGGEHPSESLGRVASAGDVNGDGFDDVLVASTQYSGEFAHEGRVLLFLGSATGPSAVPSWEVRGGEADADFGSTVACAGDVNGDGFDDVIIGAPAFHDDTSGRALLYSGTAAGLSSVPSWSADGDRPGAVFGRCVSGAGDVNGDGYDDLIVGAPQTIAFPDRGRAFVYFGSASGPSPSPNWIADNDDVYARFGWSVAGAGDVNGDGFDEVAVGADESLQGGSVSVFLGSAGGPSLVADWYEEISQHRAEFGTCVAGAGDVDGDGFSDLLVGARNYTNGEISEGAAFLYLGSPSGLSTSADWTVEGDQEDATCGSSVDGAGDVNGDGVDDVIVGVPYFDGGETQEGRALVYAGVGFADCNGNGIPDMQEIANGTSLDCNANWIPDDCDVAGELSSDCNANGIPDECDLAGGASEDRNSNGVPDECETSGQSFCFGDGGGSPCPCGNAGAAGRGCANGTVAEGARLVALGNPSVGADDVVLHAEGSVPNQPGLFFQADDAANGGNGSAFGDGLRCAVGNVHRLQIVTAGATGIATSTLAIGATGGVSSGDTRRYQWWYRDPLGSPCGTGFNLSNGSEVTWTP